MLTVFNLEGFQSINRQVCILGSVWLALRMMAVMQRSDLRFNRHQISIKDVGFGHLVRASQWSGG
jgi:hypothetical protein